MTCENCIHQNVCVHLANDANDTYAYMGVKYDFTNCKFFKDKSELVYLPCKVGGAVYEIDNSGRIYENKIRNIIFDTSGVAFDETAIGKSIFLTKEEAEKALAERG